MTTILAIDTATDACSVALYTDGRYEECYKLAPRAHNQLLFSMLREILPDGNLIALGIDAIAYGAGPGSFTGLRIAASAVQGLAFANSLSCIGVSTLAAQVQAVLRQGLAKDGDVVLSTMDARLNEVYFALYQIRDGAVVQLQEARVAPPVDVQIMSQPLPNVGVGGGMQYMERFPGALLQSMETHLLSPQLSARDLIPNALYQFKRGETHPAVDVRPVYVRQEITWKKLADQGPVHA